MRHLALIGVFDLNILVGLGVGFAAAAAEGRLDGLGNDVGHDGGFFPLCLSEDWSQVWIMERC